MRSRSSLQRCSQTLNPLCLHRLRRLPWHPPLLHLPLHLLKPLPVPPGRLLQVLSLPSDIPFTALAQPQKILSDMTAHTPDDPS